MSSAAAGYLFFRGDIDAERERGGGRNGVCVCETEGEREREIGPAVPSAVCRLPPASPGEEGPEKSRDVLVVPPQGCHAAPKEKQPDAHRDRHVRSVRHLEVRYSTSNVTKRHEQYFYHITAAGMRYGVRYRGYEGMV